jgi:hypothetical protein
VTELPCVALGGREQGATEHASKRTAMCVNERAQGATRLWAVRGGADV